MFQIWQNIFLTDPDLEFWIRVVSKSARSVAALYIMWHNQTFSVWTYFVFTIVCVLSAFERYAGQENDEEFNVCIYS